MEFSRLVEALVLEVSTGINLIKGNPGGLSVLKQIHAQTPLAHDVDWEPVKKIPWSDIKGKWGSGGGFIVLVGKNGTGAIYADPLHSGSYRVWASDGTRPEEKQTNGVYTDSMGRINNLTDLRTDSGGRALERIKEITGPIKTYAISKMAQKDVMVKRQKRGEIKKNAVALFKTNDKISDALELADRLMKRFRPLFDRALVQALADVKGFVAHQIKNDAFHKAEKRLNRLHLLSGMLRKLRDAPDEVLGGSGNTSNMLRGALINAVELAARHNYPGIPDEEHLTSRNSAYPLDAGYRSFLNDLAAGNIKLLSDILYYFKRELLTI